MSGRLLIASGLQAPFLARQEAFYGGTESLRGAHACFKLFPSRIAPQPNGCQDVFRLGARRRRIEDVDTTQRESSLLAADRVLDDQHLGAALSAADSKSWDFLVKVDRVHLVCVLRQWQTGDLFARELDGFALGFALLGGLHVVPF